MIYVTGDMHGVQNRLIYSREETLWTAQDVVIVCGDFGFLFRNNDVENCFLDDLSHRPYTLCFVDGNHENFPAIYAYPEETWCGGRIHRIFPFSTRKLHPFRATLRKSTVRRLPFSPEIDRMEKKEGILWMPK